MGTRIYPWTEGLRAAAPAQVEPEKLLREKPKLKLIKRRYKGVASGKLGPAFGEDLSVASAIAREWWG